MAFIDDGYISSIDEDELGRENLVKLIAKSIIERIKQGSHKSLSIGIYGEWGEGKTSLMKMIESELNNDGFKDIVWFNPWASSDCDQIYVDFFAALSKLSFDNELSSAISSYGRGIIHNEQFYTPVRSSYMTQLRRSLPSIDADMSSLKKNISKNLINKDKHIVVFIDDIDRLLPIEIQTVFKLSRQIADFENVIFVMGLDPKVISQAFYQIYNSEEIGRSYLEKMIQIPFVLPVIHQNRLTQLITNQLEKIVKLYELNITQYSIEELSKDLSRVLTTKRLINRYINQLNFILPAIHVEIEFEDFCYSESLKFIDEQGWLEVYRQRFNLLQGYVYDKKGDNEIKNNYDNAVSVVVNHYSSRFKSFVQSVLVEKLFPINDYYNITSSKKINNQIYFYQYFICAVPDDIIPHQEALMLKRQLCKDDIPEIIEWINEKNRLYEHSEIIRSALSVLALLKSENKDTKTIAASLCKALSFSDLTKMYGYDSINNPNTLATIICYNIIPNYLRGYDIVKDSIVENREMVSRVILEIFHQAPVKYCMNLLTNLYSNPVVKLEKELVIFSELKKRLLDYEDKELFKYSYLLKRTFLNLWIQLDLEDYLNYMKKILDQKDFDAGTFISDWLYAINDKNSEIQTLKKLLLPLKAEFENNLKHTKDPKDKLLEQFLIAWKES